MPDEKNEQIHQTLKLIKPQDKTIIIDVFISKIGQGKCGKHVREYGFGTRNERGDKLLQFYQEKKMISNTFSKLPKRMLYT